MILNPYAVLDAFVTILRLVLGILILGFTLAAWHKRRQADDRGEGSGIEDLYNLLVILGGVMLALNMAGWPLFYLMLQSYVPEWPGVMCIYGVTRIGSHSLGISRFLPGLATLLEVTKPFLVFVSGAWLVLHMANRRTATGPLTGRLLCALFVLGSIAVADSAAETAYLAIPKIEEPLDAGCCTVALDDFSQAESFLPRLVRLPIGAREITAAYYAVNGLLICGLAGAVRAASWRLDRIGLLPLVIAATSSFPISLLFLIEVAAPAILDLPYHHCPYDLLSKAPESVIAVCSYMLGMFAVGWAGLTAWLADCPETRSFLSDEIGGLLRLALFGYTGALAMIYVEMTLS